MTTQNSNNLKVTNNADGFDITGGATPRKITVTGGDVVITGVGSAVITFPSSTSTLATLALAEVFTNKTIDAALNTITIRAASDITGQLPLSKGGTAANLTDPGADVLMGWDDTDNAIKFITLGTGLTYTHATHTLSTSAGTGDVVGPSSSVDNTIVRFDSTTGKLVQTSTVTISDGGGIASTIADTGNSVGLTITQNDVTNNPNAVTITNSTTSKALAIVQTGNTSASISVGGAFNITNTNNTGPAAVFYSNKGAGRAGRLFVVYDDNSAADTDTVLFQSDSTANTVLNVKGSATGKGAVKIEQLSTTADGNASALSIDIQGSGTAAQGIFMDATVGGTTGKLMNIRNAGVEYFTVNATTGVVVNEAGTSTADFRVEGDTLANLLFTKASTDMVGINSAAPTSRFYVNGSVGSLYTAFTSGPQTLDATHHIVDCTTGTFTVNLPTAVGIAGREYIIKNSGTGVITVDGATTETIDGALTNVISVRYASITIVSDGANWIII